MLVYLPAAIVPGFSRRVLKDPFLGIMTSSDLFPFKIFFCLFVCWLACLLFTIKLNIITEKQRGHPTSTTKRINMRDWGWGSVSGMLPVCLQP